MGVCMWGFIMCVCMSFVTLIFTDGSKSTGGRHRHSRIHMRQPQ